MKRAATHLFKRQRKIALFSKLSNFYFDLRPPGKPLGRPPGKPLGRPPGKTEERKPNPRGNKNVRILGGRPGGWSGLELTDTLHHVTITRVHNILKTCTEDPWGALCKPLEYEDLVAHVCSRLKPGVASISIDYEHIRYAGPPLWKALFCLYKGFFKSGSVCQTRGGGGGG